MTVEVEGRGLRLNYTICIAFLSGDWSLFRPKGQGACGRQRHTPPRQAATGLQQARGPAFSHDEHQTPDTGPSECQSMEVVRRILASGPLTGL